MSSVSQAARNNNQPLSENKEEKKKKAKSHTFLLSESLVLVDYDRVLALGRHRGRNTTE